jgi:hypothetical protein
MNIKTAFFLLLLICTPYLCFANGNDIIPFLGFELFLIVSFLVFTINIKLNRKAKLSLVLTFIISNGLALMLTSDLPYSKNILLINSITLGLPILALLLNYVILKRYYAEWSSKKRLNVERNE